MSDTAESFAQWLREARTAAGLSQQKVADALRAQGYTAFMQTTIAKIERGVRPVRLDEAVAITALFGATVDTALRPQADGTPQGLLLQSLARRTSVLERIQTLIAAELEVTL
jgi:transcriptional regulator with XRE-family HTH domain